MKKILLVLFVVALILGLSFNADAAATKVSRATMSTSPTAPGAISDASTGNCATIDSDGSVQVQSFGSDLIATNEAFRTIAAAGDGILVSGACRVSSITVTGVAAGDWVELRDGLTVAGNCKFDPKVDTANGTTTISFPGGAAFATGVYANAISTEALVTVTYNQ